MTPGVRALNDWVEPKGEVLPTRSVCSLPRLAICAIRFRLTSLAHYRGKFRCAIMAARPFVCAHHFMFLQAASLRSICSGAARS